MLVAQRRRLILETIALQGAVHTCTLAHTLGVSEMTVRRDLAALDKEGLLLRVHGGAQTARDADVGYGLRLRRKPDAKRAIGRAAAKLVGSYETVFLDAGTTTTEVAKALRQRSDLKGVNVVTHAVNLAAELSGGEAVTVIQVGGEIYRQTYSTIGPTALETIERFSFDRMFLAAQGVDAKDGLTNSNLLEVQVKVAAMSRARWTCLVADASKWGRRSMYRIAGLNGIDAWLADEELEPQARLDVATRGVEVVVARNND